MLERFGYMLFLQPSMSDVNHCGNLKRIWPSWPVLHPFLWLVMVMMTVIARNSSLIQPYLCWIGMPIVAKLQPTNRLLAKWLHL